MRSKDILKGLVLLLLLFAGVVSLADSFSLTPGGVAFRDLQVGKGTAVVKGDVVTVHLTGWVGEHGDISRAFMNTRQEHHPVSFLVGTPRVIAGWNEGVQGMRAGGRRLLRIQPELGIGARSFEDKIPANSRLVFLVELLEVRPAQEK